VQLALLLLLGNSLAYARVDFTNPAGQLVAYGSGFSLVASLTEGWDSDPAHTKYIGKSVGHAVRYFFFSRVSYASR
jgi:hypothetical protein